jgi:hypothetical protein
MIMNICNIKDQIEEKNLILKAIDKMDSSNTEEVRRIENELDYLLYQYYKQLKCS